MTTHVELIGFDGNKKVYSIHSPHGDFEGFIVVAVTREEETIIKQLEPKLDFTPESIELIKVETRVSTFPNNKLN